MITRGSKFFYGAAAVGFVSAVLYGFLTASSSAGGVVVVFDEGGIVNAVIGPITLGWKGAVGEHIGYVVLMSFAAVMAALGGFTTAFRDADVESLAELDGVSVAEVPDPVAPYGVSLWPLLCALGAGIVVVGLAFSTVLAYAGLVLVIAGAFEWTARAWSEQATGDAEANSRYRDQLVRPVEVPIAAVLVIAVVGLAVSRVLLAIPKSAAVYVIIGLAAVIFGVANLLARRPDLKGRVLGIVVLVGLLVLIGAGIAGGVAGTRDIEEHSGEGAIAGDVVRLHSGADTGPTGTGAN